jgi:diguanylate cyclase (GGDEF)-like protein
MPLPQAAGDAILWFRPEQIRTVTWAGNPDEHVTTDPVSGRLCPRGSFTAWKAVERGRAMPWREADLAIVQELRSAVETEIAERTRDELAKLRFYDPLTGLPNRSLLQERLEDLERENIGAIALLFLDLDGFKAVNDTMGHAAGDMLLIEVAERLIGAAGPDTLTVRLGGDEFVVLCPGLDCQAVLAAGERIRQTIELPFEIAGRPCHISASIGIAAADQAAGLDLIRAADMAMYVAKQAGGNQAVLFDPSQLDRASQRFELEQDMRDALSTGDNFVLLYQPLFAIADGKKHLAGFEALVRWRHPRHGWMSPSTFIPLAERSGLILPLGDWVLATALREGRALRRANPGADLIINVNVSVLQLPRPGFCGDVAGMLEAEGFPPTGLCLEITESMLTDAASAAVLAEIRALGVEIAIDDFGIGYSSLSYLRRLPVDKVKLDRSFLEDMEGDPRGIDFVSAVIALAHAAGKPVVFEGIETQAQLDIAFITGADIVQGFFFAPPLSANAAMDLVAQYRQLDVNASRLPEA